MIQARFDTNEFGQYLGTATIIYARATAAAKAIKDYNNASLDNRVMKVFYADASQSQTSGAQSNKVDPREKHTQRARLQREERRQKAMGVRKTAGRIQKNRRDESQG